MTFWGIFIVHYVIHVKLGQKAYANSVVISFEKAEGEGERDSEI